MDPTSLQLPERIRDLPVLKGRHDAFHLAAKDCDVLFVALPAGTDIPAHDHETENLAVMVSGELIVTEDGEERRYPAGEWYHVPPGREHAIRCEVDTVQIELRFAPR